MPERDIPLSQLELSPDNVRKTPADASAFTELKASIAAHGLLENLIARSMEPGADGPGRYAVIAGGRRLAAMQALAAEGALEEDHPVPCRMIGDIVAAEEVSLAENSGDEPQGGFVDEAPPRPGHQPEVRVVSRTPHSRGVEGGRRSVRRSGRGRRGLYRRQAQEHAEVHFPKATSRRMAITTASAINHHQFANQPESVATSMSSKPILSNWVFFPPFLMSAHPAWKNY